MWLPDRNTKERKKFRYKIKCPNPNCGKLDCWDHCKNCGNPIKWRPDALDREIKYTGPKPLNMDESVHRCAHEWDYNEMSYAVEMGFFLKHGYPHEHYKTGCKICVSIVEKNKWVIEP
jgi:hypothetical protein